MRSQFGHVIDIAPTVLEAANLPEPKVVNGTPQIPIEGTSLLYTFNDADAAERHHTQYFEIFGNRAIYRDGWFARTIHRAPWQTGKQKPLAEDVWDLYHVDEDFSLANNLAEKHPEKLEQMKALFMTEAAKYNVLPIDDRTIERVNPATAGRPDIMGSRTSLTLYPGMNGMMENTFINVKNKSKTITAEIEIPKGGASGALLVQGGRYGGWSLHMRDGKPAYEYNWLGLERFVIESPTELPEGPATIVLAFTYDGGGMGKGGAAKLSVNGKQVAEGRIGQTQGFIFSADETADVGLDNQTPVALGIGYGPTETTFSGRIEKITIEVK
jgi:arylsulfatase